VIKALFANMVKLKAKLSIIGLTIALLIGVVYYFYTGKAHNPVTEMASDIIQNQTGINLEKLLPEDDANSTATP